MRQRILGFCSFVHFSVVPSKNPWLQMYIKIHVTDSHLFSDMQICFDIAVTTSLGVCQGKVSLRLLLLSRDFEKWESHRVWANSTPWSQGRPTKVIVTALFSFSSWRVMTERTHGEYVLSKFWVLLTLETWQQFHSSLQPSGHSQVIPVASISATFYIHCQDYHDVRKWRIKKGPVEKCVETKTKRKEAEFPR